MTDKLCPDISAEAKMASAVERTDELVREYLIYRGFTSTLKYLDSEIKTDKEKGFRVRTKSQIFSSQIWTSHMSYTNYCRVELGEISENKRLISF